MVDISRGIRLTDIEIEIMCTHTVFWLAMMYRANTHNKNTATTILAV